MYSYLLAAYLEMFPVAHRHVKCLQVHHSTRTVGHVLSSQVSCGCSRAHLDHHETYVHTWPIFSDHDTSTHPAKPFLWVIELHNGQDNRLTTVMIDNAIKPALDAVENDWHKQWARAQQVKGKVGAEGALVIVGKRGQDKFFSNGELIYTPRLQSCAQFAVRRIRFPKHRG